MDEIPDSINGYDVKSWAEILKFPSASLVVGGRGKGKSATGYYILTVSRRLFDIQTYVKGLPEEKWHLLPPEIKPIPIEERDLPDDAAIFVDEAAMWYYAREFGNDLNKAMDVILSISRQRKQLVVFATHYTRKLDINIVTDMDMLAFKQPGLLHKYFERRELRKIVDKVYRLFKMVPDPKQRYTYVITDDFEGFVVNPLPDFWSEALSYAFAGVKIEDVLNLKKVKGEKEPKMPLWKKMLEEYVGETQFETLESMSNNPK